MTKSRSWTGPPSRQPPCKTSGPCPLPKPLRWVSKVWSGRRGESLVPCTLPHRRSNPRSRTGEKQARMPIDLASAPMARPTRCTKPVSKLADSPRACGNIDCLKEPTPWRHSPKCRKGTLSRALSRFRLWTESWCDLFRVYLDGSSQHLSVQHVGNGNEQVVYCPYRRSRREPHSLIYHRQNGVVGNRAPTAHQQTYHTGCCPTLRPQCHRRTSSAVAELAGVNYALWPGRSVQVGGGVPRSATVMFATSWSMKASFPDAASSLEITICWPVGGYDPAMCCVRKLHTNRAAAARRQERAMFEAIG